MKTKEDILKETIEYYSQPGRRAILVNSNGDQLGCAYLTDKEQMCAVGRCLTSESLEMLKETDRLASSIDTLDEENPIDGLLKEEYTGHDINFWKRLQEIHDFKDNWDKESKLTEIGKKQVNMMITDFILNMPLLN